mmetsp:Transcript_30952/g.65626  ORF Transcript_30952/g.65626 Transcript_30952/m.65626 type:complete len:755 (-) Transcript_30952:388-2652(-)
MATPFARSGIQVCQVEEEECWGTDDLQQDLPQQLPRPQQPHQQQPKQPQLQELQELQELLRQEAADREEESRIFDADTAEETVEDVYHKAVRAPESTRGSSPSERGLLDPECHFWDAGECLLRIRGPTGQVVLQGVLQNSHSILTVKREIERAEHVSMEDFLLLWNGTPMCNSQTLEDVIGDGTVELQMRRTCREWVSSLEDIARGVENFLEASMRLRSSLTSAVSDTEQRVGTLKEMAKEMDLIFQAALKGVNESGAALLASASDLQRNRDTVFEVLPRSSKGCRQAAEELLLCRNNVLRIVDANGEVLLGLRDQLGPVHKVFQLHLRETLSALAIARETFRREYELLHLGQVRNYMDNAMAEELCKKLAVSLKDIERQGKDLAAMSEVVAACRQAYRRTIVVNRNAIRQAEASLRRDKEVLFGWAADHVSEIRKTDRQFMLTLLEANGEALERAPEALRRDRELVLLAVRQSDGWALQFAAEELKNDKEIVLTAVKRNGWALEHASEELKQDREVVLAAVQANGEALEFAGDGPRHDREVVLAAVRRSGGWALNIASESLRNERQVAEAAINQNGRLLAHVSEDLKSDRDFVFPALRANGMALEYCSESLRRDKKCVVAAVTSNPQALQFAAAALKDDLKVVTIAVTRDGFALKHASTRLRADRDIVLAAIREGGLGVLDFADAAVKIDPDIQALLTKAQRSSAKPEEPACGDDDDAPPQLPPSERAVHEDTVIGEPAKWAPDSKGPDCVHL